MRSWEYPENENAYHDVHGGEYFRHHKIKAGELVLDLGAHVGYFAELAHKLGAKVISFEPHPDNYKALLQRVSQLDDMVTMNAAACNHNGKQQLFHCENNSGAHSLISRPDASEKVFMVEAVDIGTWLKNAAFKPDFIKIDTEGSEYAILQSLFDADMVSDCAVEIHSSQLYTDCRNLVEKNGLKFLPETTNIGVCYITK